MNEDLKHFLGLPAGEKPDFKLSDEQDKDNKKNQKEISGKVNKDSRDDKAELDFSASVLLR